MVMERAEVTIESIASGGDGVARADGLVLFVPRAAPGDRAIVEYQGARRFARARLVELIEPSSERIPPACGHYTVDRCGGCQLQHVSYPAQLAAKRRIVTDAIERIGRRDADVEPTQASPHEWRYRRKLTLALRRRAGQWIAGLHPYDAPGEVFALADCPITDDGVLAVWREILVAADTLPEMTEARGAVRLDAGGASFVLEGGTHWERSEELFARAPSLGAIWWVPARGRRRLLHVRGVPHAPGASFVQVNAAVATAVTAHVLARVAAHAPSTVVDAYAGLGDAAVALAREGARVTAIELDRDASRWCAARLPDGSRAVAGRVEDELPRALPADVVILNPPRAGVDERVTATLDAATPAPRAVLYVSCDPATLARDVRRLPSYRVTSLAPFDMFPQTAHVETVCELVPVAA